MKRKLLFKSLPHQVTDLAEGRSDVAIRWRDPHFEVPDISGPYLCLVNDRYIAMLIYSAVHKAFNVDAELHPEGDTSITPIKVKKWAKLPLEPIKLGTMPAKKGGK